ncbi:AraC family transcriptional regulator [Halobacillus salinarum]|uniref:AraC family transcriptional regulator n=1 Tax=Halobacillus salinarum TaxID=2932257 RepID=A0ABY4ENM8_9BACI|nr:AraC family transcriptional regulator [Halobacillus salinarum]UOQ45799.1 AraC family transcriptional regulator [Halobacillus salinarum]
MSEKDFPFCINRKIHTKRNLPPVHDHDFIELVYVLEGEAEHIFEREGYGIEAGDVFIINPGEVHTYKIGHGHRFEIINCLFMPTLFDEAWLRGLGISESMDYFYVHPFLNTNDRFHHCLNLRGEDAVTVLSSFETIIEEYVEKRSDYMTLIRLKLVQLLLQLSRYYGEKATFPCKASRRKQERKIFIQRICGYIERHYNQKLSLGVLSELFNISSRHLNRIFKEETGKTVIEFVHHVRINKAKKLFTDTDKKVLTIAMEVGYDDPAFFTRLFTREVGCSPGKYRGLDHDKGMLV